MIKITKAQSKRLNKKIEEAEDWEKHDLFLAELSAAGKIIPYVGDHWINVDFTKPIRLGHCVEFVGFMEDNKWGYPTWQLSGDQNDILKILLLDLDLTQGKDAIESSLREIYNIIQLFLPSGRDVETEALEAISYLISDETKIEGGIHVR